MKIRLYFMLLMSLGTIIQADSWKVVFYKTYLEQYKKLKPTTYDGFSQIVLKAWAAAKKLIPKHSVNDKQLAHKINDQVAFFTSLTDVAMQEQETKKCIDGMKKAQSVLAGFVSSNYKAKRFVQGFVKEYNQRHAI